MNRVRTGRKLERRVAMYLRERGYEILATNYQCGHREIDIIAEKNGLIVFVEVRFKSSDVYGSALESITRKKIRNIVEAARLYIHRYGLYNRNVRFDVASIDGERLTYVEGAFNS
jgi:putative endonuclease